ncbi:autophagy-related protein 2 homolog B isoform X2 [Nematostella vectensis]|nr:autophagy-related protein 2 homolog B isoform X2 [Nematostella vectensis]
MLESSGMPFEIIDGYIHRISVSVPWSALLSDSCCMDIQGLELTLAMRQRADSTGSMTESMIFNNMTTSMELAQECLRQAPSPGEEQAEATQQFEGLESFAQTIESVLARIKLAFADTVIRIEHLPKDTKSGIGLELHIKRIDYSDLSTELAEGDNQYKPKSVYEPAAFAYKNLKIYGISAYLDEFHETARTVPSTIGHRSPDSPPPSPNSGASSPPISLGSMGNLANELYDKSKLSQTSLLPAIQIANFAGNQEVKLRVKQNSAIPGTKIDVECFLGTLNLFLAPRQVHLLLELASGLSVADSTSTPEEKKKTVNKPMGPDDFKRIEEDLQNQLTSKRHTSRQNEGQNRVDSWNFSFESSSTVENSTNLSSGADYDSVLDDEEEKFYSMPSAGCQWAQDILPPLEEPQLPEDMLGFKKPSGSYISQGLGTLPKLGPSGQSLTQAASSVFLSSQATSQGSVPSKPASISPLSPVNPGLAGIAALDDPYPEAMRLKLKLSSAAITVLHVDPVLSPVTDHRAPDDVDNMSSSHPLLQMAEGYFHALGTYVFGGKDFEGMKDRLVDACPNDHLRCIVAPFSLELERSATSMHQTFTSEVTVGRLELLEYLFDRSSTNSTPSSPYATTQLLHFTAQEDSRNAFFSMAAPKPCLRAKYKNTQRTASPGVIQTRNPILPKTELSLELGKLCSEVDITIIDRLAAIIYPESLYSTQSPTQHSRMFKSLNPTSYNQQVVFTQALDEGPVNDQRLNVSLSCPELSVMLRFPIPDLRPVVERRPWWKQAVRDESLLLVFSAFKFNTVVCSADPAASYELRFQQMDGYYKESAGATPIPVMHSSPLATDNENSNGGFDWPRVVITTQPLVPLSVLEEVHSGENSPLSSLEAYPVIKNKPSPFSSKPVMFEAEELVLPGNQEDMHNFQQDTIATSQCRIEFTLPRLDINLHTKDLFEKIYNRIASDLLLWEPAAPCPVDRPDTYGTNITTAGLDLASQLIHAQGGDKFVMCRSGLRSYDDSSSDDEDSSSLTSPEHRYRRTNSDHNGQTLLSITLNVSRGRLALFPNSENPSCKDSKHDAPSTKQEPCLGEIMVELDDLSFFAAACYKGNVDLSYICLQAKKGTLYHAPIVPSNAHVAMETAFSGAELQSTMYLSEHCERPANGDSVEPMLSLAVKSLLDPSKNVKEILFTLGLRDATIRHRIFPSNRLWLSQVSDYMDVVDEPVLGFVPPAVLTVLHTHVWSGAIDYRPIHVPLRVLLTFGSFSVSSNLTIESSISLLRFIIDDAALHLSDKCSGPANLRNYVCVMDIGLFQLSLLTSDGSEQHPKVELRMSSNTLNVRTCSDSFSALLRLIQYIAADGDMVPSYETEEPDPASAPPTPSRCPADPPVQQGEVDEGQMSSLMREAMADDVTADSGGESDKDEDDTPDISQEVSRSPKRDLFLFPDDKPDKTIQVPDTSRQTSWREGKDDASDEEKDESDDDDDEFCILDHPDREPEGLTDDVVIKTLVQDKIEIRENHFSLTIGRSDQLRAPDHYPPPVFRYSLREMSVIWHMYGGRDLGSGHQEEEKKKKRITFASDLTSPTRSSPRPPPSPSVTAATRAQGGLGRQMNVLMELHLNKIRFQYEDYPDDTEQASRLVFLAQEVEMRDRLANSQINKFLYQHTSESRPKQTHANMVVVKMLYIRPDPQLKAQECCMRVSLQPLRLNVDQDSLFFLRDFFTDIAGEASKTSKGTNSVESSPIKTPTPPSTLSPDLYSELLAPDHEELPLIRSTEELEDESAQAPTFFRSFIFSPEVPIRLDYQGKHVDMDQGTLAGLLIGLAQLNCSELTLKRLCCRSGLLGMDRVIAYALQEWLNDIKRTQLPRILGGVGPVHSFVQLFQGVMDLVWLPIEQYRRDGRVIRGLQRGANSFTTSSAMAFLELTNRAVQMLQSAAETAYDMVSPGPSVSPYRRGRHRLARQPADLREGVANAYNVVTKGLNRTASNIAKVARDEHEEKGMTGAVGGVLRQVPATMVQPLILATEATSNVIGGVRNQILPDARREAVEKWRD